MLGMPAIIAAISRLNEKSSLRILADLPSITGPTAKLAEIISKGLMPFCEHAALYLSAPGLVYKALEVPPDTPVLSDVDRQAILDALCCFYDFSKVKPSNKGGLMDAWNKAVDSQPEWRRIY